MTKRRTFIIIYVLLMLCFLSWMLFSNQLFLKYGGNASVKRVSLDEYSDATDTVYYAIDSLQPIGDLLETVTIRGWAYTETEYDNAICKTELLLVSDSTCYSLEFNDPQDSFAYEGYVLRPDIVKAFPYRKIYSENVGYISDFSTFGIENGVYDLYIYRWENEHNSGLMQTKWQIIKDNAEMTLRNWQASKVKIDTSNAIDGKEVYSSLDTATIDDEVLALQGWAFIDGKDTTDQKVYLQIQDSALNKCYTTLSVSRHDVAQAYQNEDYRISGFASNILLNEMQSNELTVTIFIEIGGQIYQGNTYDIAAFENPQ